MRGTGNGDRAPSVFFVGMAACVLFLVLNCYILQAIGNGFHKSLQLNVLHLKNFFCLGSLAFPEIISYISNNFVKT